MPASITHEGVEYAVSDAWHAQNTERWPHFASLTKQQIDDRREALKALDRARLLPRHAELGSNQELWHLDHHFNLRNALDVLGADAHVIHGLPGVEHLHGGGYDAPCGCSVLEVQANAVAADARDAAVDIVVPHPSPQVMARRWYIWRHRAALSGDDPEHPEIAAARSHVRVKLAHRPVYVCAAHAHLADDWDALNAAVIAAAKAQREAEAAAEG